MAYLFIWYKQTCIYFQTQHFQSCARDSISHCVGRSVSRSVRRSLRPSHFTFFFGEAAYRDACARSALFSLKFYVSPHSHPGTRLSRNVPRQVGLWNIKASLTEFRHQMRSSDLLAYFFLIGFKMVQFLVCEHLLLNFSANIPFSEI